MFYVSSIRGNKIGVTDTSDGVEVFCTDKDIYNILKDKNRTEDIYGTSPYNGMANCTVLKINQSLSKSKLLELMGNWKKVHNQWSGYPVDDYLAEAKLDTKIVVTYSYYGDGDRKKHTGKTVLEKLSWDSWKYEDTNSTFSGRYGDSRFAARCLESACIYSNMLDLAIKE